MLPTHLLLAALSYAPEPLQPPPQPAHLLGRWRLVSLGREGKPKATDGMFAVEFSANGMVHREFAESGEVRQFPSYYQLTAARIPWHLDRQGFGRCGDP